MNFYATIPPITERAQHPDCQAVLACIKATNAQRFPASFTALQRRTKMNDNDLRTALETLNAARIIEDRDGRVTTYHVMGEG